ncbi:MAG: N-acetylmuramoyl-L-alanine amidase [Firmicutes bacterium]|nr:N-acetylmuramoyl-L-alanine amidase [Bacillota bacterium]
MKKVKSGAVACLLLALVILLAACGRTAAQEASPSAAAETAAAETALQPEYIRVYGESALVGVAGRAGCLTLEGGSGNRHYTVQAGSGKRADQGLLLWQLPAGEYSLSWGRHPLAAGELWLPQGYTLPRQGKRLHWAFDRDEQGLLILKLTEVRALPEGWYDVIVDAGHGGGDSGAAGGGYSEADLNLINARILADCLREQGLVVALTRDSRDLPGGAAAETDPYVRGGRVELIYASHAPYLLSCHLNAADGQQAGFQIYGSVAASIAWPQAVADALRQAGMTGSDSGRGLVAPGVYQRHTRNLLRLRDYYFILRETGGYAVAPANYLASHREQRESLAVGAQGLLLELAFIDNDADLRQWLERRREWLAAAAQGCAEYWHL